MKHSIKVFWALALIAALLAGLAVISVSAVSDDPIFANPGTYTASSIGKNGEITLTVT